MRAIERAKAWMNIATTEGWVTLAPGIFLDSRENICAKQRGWDDADAFKRLDFNSHAFWLTTGAMGLPRGVNTPDELAELLLKIRGK